MKSIYNTSATLGLLGLLLAVTASGVVAQSTVIGTSADTSGDSLFMNLTYANGNPNRIVMVTPVWNPNDIYENHPIGVWYNGSEWAAFNQDAMSMPVGAAFNEYDGNASGNVFVQRAAGANISGNVTYINSAATNGKPNAKLFVTPNWNPGGVYAGYCNHNIGVWYNASRRQWAIFNEDLAGMASGLAFNVIALQPSTGYVLTHTASRANTVENCTYLPEVSTDPTAILFATQCYNPSSVYNNHAIGVWFDAARHQWAVFNQDGSGMPSGASFNLWVNLIPR